MASGPPTPVASRRSILRRQSSSNSALFDASPIAREGAQARMPRSKIVTHACAAAAGCTLPLSTLAANVVSASNNHACTLVGNAFKHASATAGHAALRPVPASSEQCVLATSTVGLRRAQTAMAASDHCARKYEGFKMSSHTIMVVCVRFWQRCINEVTHA